MSNAEHVSANTGSRYSDLKPVQRDVIESVEANLRTYLLRIDTRGRTGNQTGFVTDEDGEKRGEKNVYITPLRLARCDAENTTEFLGLRAGHREVPTTPVQSSTPSPQRRRWFGRRNGAQPTEAETLVVQATPRQRIPLEEVDVTTGKRVPFSSLSYSINGNPLASGDDMLPRTQRLVLDGHVPNGAGEAFLEIGKENPQVIRSVFSALRDHVLETPYWRDNEWYNIGYDTLPRSSTIILGSVSLEGDQKTTEVVAGPYSRLPKDTSEAAWPVDDPDQPRQAIVWPTAEQP